MKVCSCCKNELSSAEYYTSNPWTCITCVKARSAYRYNTKREECVAKSKIWVANNPEKVRATKAAYRERNRDTAVAWHRFRRLVEPEKNYEIQLRYREANPEVYAAAQARRRAAELQATPKWADQGKITWFYAEAARRTAVLGHPYEVDHIVPLQGVLVSGLHVEHNLRVVPRPVNRRKSNKHEEVPNA